MYYKVIMGCGASVMEEGDTDTDDNNGRLGVNKNGHRKSFFRGSIISSIISKDQNDDEEVSDTESNDSAVAVITNEQIEENNECEKREMICSTDVSIQFIIEVISQRFHKEIDGGSSWIAERLNSESATEAASVSAVIRLTFGWEEIGLPHSYVLKVPVCREARDGDKGKALYTMFKRECNTYEWVHNFKKIVAPEIYYIKKHHNESGGAMILMEDLLEKGNEGNDRDGLSIDIVRDLLKRLALIHAQSRRENSWSTVIVDLPSSYFSSISSRYLEIREFCERHEVERSRMEAIKKYFSVEYLQQTILESCDELNVPKVLVHGEPYAKNVFEKDGIVVGLLNWSVCHSGCFGEDLAKVICWNLSMKERIEYTTNLLESYHIHFVRYAGIECALTFDLVRRAFDKFVPLAMVLFLNKILTVADDHKNEPIFERARTLIQNVYSNDRILEDAATHKVSIQSIHEGHHAHTHSHPNSTNWDNKQHTRRTSKYGT